MNTGQTKDYNESIKRKTKLAEELFCDILEFDRNKVYTFRDLTRKKVIEKLGELKYLAAKSDKILAIGISWIGL